MPYLTTAEYLAAPTRANTNSLAATSGGVTAELANCIARASSWIDSEVGCSLIASSSVSAHPVYPQSDGTLSIHPNRVALNQITALSLGWSATSLFAVSDLTGAWIDEEQFVIPAVSPYASATPIQFGRPLGKILAKLTAVCGWPNTVLVGNPIQGATSITVASGVGFTPILGSICSDQTITIYDGANTEIITVSAVAGNVLTCSALAFAHSAGVAVSALPYDVKQAAIYATTGYVRQGSSDAIVAPQSLQPGGLIGSDPPMMSAFAQAKALLRNYSRVR